MTLNKKILSGISVLLAILFAVILLSLPKSFSAFADSASIPEPDVTGITGSMKAPYKDMFYVGAYTDNSTNYTLHYRYYQPQDMSERKEKVPLIIFLHGRGERGSDNDMQLDNAILRPFIENENSKFYDAMVIAPQCPVKDYNNGWVELFSDDETANALAYANYSVDAVEESNECKAIMALIEDTCQKQNVDRNRIYIIGLSQGAVATWYLLAKHPNVFAAAVPIAGVGDVSKAEIYANIPIYAFHGDADTTVKYATATPKMYEAINAVGKGKMHFVTFEGGPHAIWESAIVFKGTDNLPALETWLFSQSKATEKKGCGASIDARIALVFVPVIAMGAAVAMKKKEENN